jgi:hypothetical protein
MGKVGKTKLQMLTDVGEEEILGMISNGKNPSDVIKHFNVGWNIFYKWVNDEEGRAARYKQARDVAGHKYASKAEEVAEAIHLQEASVNSARLAVDTYKWLAAKANDTYDTRQSNVAVNVSVTDLHAQAAKLMASIGGDVIDAEVVPDEVEDDEE